MSPCSIEGCTSPHQARGLCSRHYHKDWAARNPVSYTANSRQFHRNNPNYRREYYTRLKTEVLTHYGPNKQLRCSHPDCTIDDLDILTLDHINNDGHLEPHGKRGGTGLYMSVKQRGFPEGFQTLCCNHQWKKEVLRRRSEEGN